MSRQPKIGEPLVINVTAVGAHERVLSAKEGMTFVVDAVTERPNGELVCHVRDYRYDTGSNGYQIWSLGPEHYDVLIKQYQFPGVEA
jgi:hypothetical protein